MHKGISRMNKYRTGQYHLHLFDKHGTKRETRVLSSYTAAKLEGVELIKEPPFASFAVTRVLHNSIDTAFPWDVDPTKYVEVLSDQQSRTEESSLRQSV